MTYVTIHESGESSEKLTVDSWYNGDAYAINFGCAGSPMRTIWFQGDDATQLRDEYESLEHAKPQVSCREHWLSAVWPYL